MLYVGDKYILYNNKVVGSMYLGVIYNNMLLEVNILGSRLSGDPIESVRLISCRRVQQKYVVHHTTTLYIYTMYDTLYHNSIMS